MANTTCVMISCFDGREVVASIAEKVGLDIRKVSNSYECGGTRAVSFDSYAFCCRCIGGDRIDQLIAEFKSAPWMYPENAVMLISDDTEDEYDGVYVVMEPK